jgi:hypothetical protein
VDKDLESKANTPGLMLSANDVLEPANIIVNKLYPNTTAMIVDLLK